MRYLKIISSLGKSALIYIFISLLFPVNFKGIRKGVGGGGGGAVGGQLTGFQRFVVAPMKQTFVPSWRK